MNRSPKLVTLTVAAMVSLAGAPAAQACCGDVDGGVVVAAAVAAALIPSEIGAHVSGASRPPDFVLGWSWQLPLDVHSAELHHRVVGGVDYLAGPAPSGWRGRVGYRYARGPVMAGLGASLTGAGATLSPELGIKAASGGSKPIALQPHLLARAEIAPASGDLRGLTVLLGWTVF